MADTKDLVAKRRVAYAFVRDEICKLRKLSGKVSDAQLVAILGATKGLEEALSLLRKGESNPTESLVAAFRREFKQEMEWGLLRDSDIEAYLVAPFKNA